MTPMLVKGYRYRYSLGYFYKQACIERAKRRHRWLKHQTFLLIMTIVLGSSSLVYSSERLNRVENSIDRVEGGKWVIASMYWEDKVVSTGKKFNPVGLYIAHKTLPIGTHVRVTNPANKRSINVIVNDRGPYIPGREIDLTGGAGTLLNFKGLGTLYLEVIHWGPSKINRPVLETLFDTRINFFE